MRVIVVSPYRGDVELNKRYLVECLRDCIRRRESPFAGHLFYTQFLNDEDPVQRDAGMACGREWMKSAELVAVYTDIGVSSGMHGDMDYAISYMIPIEKRELPPEALARVR